MRMSRSSPATISHSRTAGRRDGLRRFRCRIAARNPHPVSARMPASAEAGWPAQPVRGRVRRQRGRHEQLHERHSAGGRIDGARVGRVTPVADVGRSALAEQRGPRRRHDHGGVHQARSRRRRRSIGVDRHSCLYAAVLRRLPRQRAWRKPMPTSRLSSATIPTAPRSRPRRARAQAPGCSLSAQCRPLARRGNFTKCFESARGEFVKFLCDDDLLAPTCVASLLDAFRRAPDITLATSRRRRIDENGNRLDDQPATLPIVAANTTIAGYTLANAMLMAGLNTVGEPTTVLFRKADLLDQAPDYFRFNGAHGHGIIDMVMWSALLLKGDAVYLTESLSAFPHSRGAAAARSGDGTAQYRQHPRACRRRGSSSSCSKKCRRT